MQTAIAAIRHLFPAHAEFSYPARGRLCVEWPVARVGSQGLATQSVQILIGEGTLTRLERIDPADNREAVERIHQVVEVALKHLVASGGLYQIDV